MLFRLGYLKIDVCHFVSCNQRVCAKMALNAGFALALATEKICLAVTEFNDSLPGEGETIR